MSDTKLTPSEALEARIAARRAADTNKLREAAAADKKPKAVKKPKAEKPVKTEVVVAAAEDAPWEAEVTPGAKAEKPKRVVKPRTVKVKPEVAAEGGFDIQGMVEKITAKATAAAEKAHKAEIAKLQAEHKLELKTAIQAAVNAAKEAKTKFVEELKNAVDVTEKKAYAAGLKAGEAAARKAFVAAMKAV